MLVTLDCAALSLTGLYLALDNLILFFLKRTTYAFATA